MLEWKPDEDYDNADWPKRTPDTIEYLEKAAEKERKKGKRDANPEPQRAP